MEEYIHVLFAGRIVILVDRSLRVYLYQINLVLTISSVSEPLSFALVEGIHPRYGHEKWGTRETIDPVFEPCLENITVYVDKRDCCCFPQTVIC